SEKLLTEYLSDISFIKSMLREAENISAPCLVLQGEEDYQVSPRNDFSLLKDSLQSRKNWRFVSFPSLTHLFTPGQRSEGNAVYLNPEKVAPQVISEIASFVSSR
ncbi:MAG: hypothetical protein Q4G19_00520, partial [Clostridia bacterium]|nr:hypothetical protein [Clostridia bacterium]